MKKFILNLFLFLLPIFCLLILSFQINTEIDSRRNILLNKVKKEKNIIFIGDSKSLISYNYKLLKSEFPNYTISNLSIWAKNPQYCYSVYQDILRKKIIKNSIIIFGTTYPHILNRENLDWQGWSLKNKLGALLNIKRFKLINYDFKHIISENGFININDQKFGTIESGKLWYASLEKEYNADFNTQIEYIKKIESLFKKEDGNLFFVCELPHDTIIEQIYNHSEYYSAYQKEIKTTFTTNHIDLGFITELNQNKFWYNRNHLSFSGAEAFTPIFCDSLKVKLLEYNY